MINSKIKKILFDSQAFQHLVLQPKYYDQFQQLKNLIKNDNVVVLGNIPFLEELIGLSLKNSNDYKKVFGEYKNITNQKLIKPYNELIFMEINNRAPLKQENIFLSNEKAKEVFDELEKGPNLQTLDDLIYNNKQNNLSKMEKANKTAKEKFSSNNKIMSERKTGAKEWLKNFGANIQSWGEGLFNSSGKIDFTLLPHTASFISCLLIKLHQTTMSGQKHKASDEYDRKHISEAAAVNVFITEDKALTNMYNQIPNKYKFVQVQKIKKFFDTIN